MPHFSSLSPTDKIKIEKVKYSLGHKQVFQHCLHEGFVRLHVTVPPDPEKTLSYADDEAGVR